MEETTISLSATSGDYGLTHFWAESDITIKLVALTLLIMSVLSWTQIALKIWQASLRKHRARNLEIFWQAPSLQSAVSKLTKDDPESPFTALSLQALNSAQHFDNNKGKTIGAEMNRGEFITQALRQSIVQSTAKLEAGLTLLASIGSIAPFVGLFGTVWGIYHALITISASGSASLDKVSGPVGEALIMTAAGLFVAIPAVLAYNAFTRFNRLELASLDGFAHDLHAYLSIGSRVKLTGKKGKS